MTFKIYIATSMVLMGSSIGSAMAQVEPSDIVGKTDCRYGDAACSVCAARVMDQVRDTSTGDAPDGVDLDEESFGYRLEAEKHSGSFWNHIQGMARLADLGRSDGNVVGRTIITDNGSFGNEGLQYFEQVVPEGLESVFYSRDRNDSLRMRKIPIRGEYKHPGGAQGHGNTVVIGMEDGPAGRRAAALFYGFGNSPMPKFLGQYVLEGAESAGGAAFVQLRDRRFLLATVGQATNGDSGIRFYRTKQPSDAITTSTSWEFLSMWVPVGGSRTDGKQLDERFGGAQSLALITDCNGTIYLFSFNGSEKQIPNYQWFQVYEVSVTPGGSINLRRDRSNWGQRDKLNGSIGNNNAFRYGATVHVTKNGGLVFFNTERRAGGNRFIGGNVYASSHAMQMTCADDPILFEDDWYRKDRFVVRRDELDMTEFGWGGNVSSVCVPSGKRLTLFRKKDHQGDRPVVINGPDRVADLSARDIEDNVKSVAVSGAETPPPCTRPVLYSRHHYFGDSTTIESDYGDGPKAKQASSACIPEGWRISIFDKANFDGAKQEIRGPQDILNFRTDIYNRNWDGKVRSVSVVPTSNRESYVQIRRRPFGPVMCLHKEANGPGGPNNPNNYVHIWTCGAGPYQNSTWFYDNERQLIRNAGYPGMCIHKADDNWNNGNRLIVWSCAEGPARMKTWIVDQGEGYIRAAEQPTKCIHKMHDHFDPGNPVHLWDCDVGTPNNKVWRFATLHSLIDAAADDESK